jgi:predicted O-methyltransferase YrrM
MSLDRVLRRTLARLVSHVPRAVLLSSDVFDVWERAGYHVTPNHFYSPIPDLGSLSRRVWEDSECIGVDFREAAQLELLDRFESLRREYAKLDVSNPYYGALDAEVLYSMIRLVRPERIVEVGSGFSTDIALTALKENGSGCIECIEPFEPERMPIRPKYVVPVQEVPLEEFESLEAGDILFIDSSHVVKLGSDVRYEYLEILPRLQPGVIVHVHDIFLPHEYPREWAHAKRRFWTEQYLLQAFLVFNDTFEVVWASSFMLHRHERRIRAAFPSLDNTSQPGSFWLRRRS